MTDDGLHILIFFKRNYPTYFETLLPKVKSGGLLIVDNALWSGKVTDPQDQESEAIHQLNQMAVNHPETECVMLPIRDGILLIRKK